MFFSPNLTDLINHLIILLIFVFLSHLVHSNTRTQESCGLKSGIHVVQNSWGYERFKINHFDLLLHLPKRCLRNSILKLSQLSISPFSRRIPRITCFLWRSNDCSIIVHFQDLWESVWLESCSPPGSHLRRYPLDVKMLVCAALAADFDD